MPIELFMDKIRQQL